MLLQAMFSLVAGGLMGWAVGFIILKNAWLTRATIRFLRIAMWFPFLVLFAVLEIFTLGIAVSMLAAIYHYLTARWFFMQTAPPAVMRLENQISKLSSLACLPKLGLGDGIGQYSPLFPMPRWGSLSLL